MDLNVSVSFFKDELGPSIEQAVQAAVESVLREISKLIGGRLVGLQAELAETANENRSLRRRLRRSESELKSVRERERTVVRPAPRFDEQLGAPAWGSTPVCTPLQQQQQQQQQDRAGEPSVSFLGDANGTGSEYTAAGFARCLPVLMSRDCAGDAAPLAERETSHLIIQADGTDRSVSIRDDEFPRIDDLWGGGCGGVVVGGPGRGIEESQGYEGSQERRVQSEDLDSAHIKEELADIRSVLIGDEGLGAGPVCATDPVSGPDPILVKEELPDQDCVEIREELNHPSAGLPGSSNYTGSVTQLSVETDKAASFKKPRTQAKWQQPRKIGKTHTFAPSAPGSAFPGFRRQHQHASVSEKACDSPQSGQSLGMFESLRQHQRLLTGEKPFHSPESGKRFKEAAQQLRQHERLLPGESRHPCNVCGKSFTRLKTLHIHQRIHTGEKPYPCTHCGTSFRHLDSLKKHQRIHTGEKPYKCAECGNIYRHLTSLKHHQRIHAGQRS